MDDLPSSDDLVFIVKPCRFPHCFDYLEDTHTFPFAQVVGLEEGVSTWLINVRLWRQCVKGKDMARGQIHDMEVIPNTSTVAMGGIRFKIRKKRGEDLAYGVG